MAQFSESDVNKLKNLVREGIQVTEEVSTLKEGLRDTVKAVAEEIGVKPAVLNKAIRIAHKAELEKEREDFDELESILQVTGRG